MPHTRDTAHRYGLSHPRHPIGSWCFWLLDGLTPSWWGALKDSLWAQGLLAQDSTKCMGSPRSWTGIRWTEKGSKNLHVSQVAYTSLHPVLSVLVGRSRALKAATSILMCAGEAQSLGRWVILPGAVPGWVMCPAAGSPAGCSAAASQRCQWTSPWRAHYSCLDISHTPSRQRFHLW